MSQSANLLLPFQFHKLPVRGRLLRLHGLSMHVPSLAQNAACAQTLAEILASAALLAYDTKYSMSVSLQLQHPELGVLIFAQAAVGGALRAYANDIAQATPFATVAQTPGGIFAVTLEPEDMSQRYQSLIPLEGDSAAACIASYFKRSVQTPTLISVFANGEDATALMLQALPAENSNAKFPEDDWHRLGLILQTLTAQEALDPSLSSENLLGRLFAEDDVSLFEAEHPAFAHDDPRPRMLAALAGLPPEELAELMEDGTITLTDQTTGQAVTFSAEELAHLQDGATDPDKTVN